MSTIKVNAIQNTSGVEQYLCKAWVNFNGTGTVAIRASGNVSSITDNGTGDYTVNFTTAMADTNYCVVTGSSGGGNTILTQNAAGTVTAPTTTAVRLYAVGVIADPTYAQIAIFR